MPVFTDIEIYDYSERSFVVRGETKQYRDSMVALGGKWNSRLSDKETGDKFGGWIFPAAKRMEVETWKGKGEHLEAPPRASPPRASPQSQFSRAGGSDRQLLQKLAVIEQNMERIEKLLLRILGDKADPETTESEVVVMDSDEEEANKPRPRLLSKPKPKGN